MYSLDYCSSLYFSPCGVPVTAILRDFLTVWTEMSSSAKVSDEPEKWSSNYFYSSYDGHEEERPLMVSNDILR